MHGIRTRRALALACSVVALALTLSLGAGPARALGFTFDTLPADGEIVAAAGETVGFGYQITNTSLDRWLVLAALDAGVFGQGTPDAGLFDFPILAPGTSITVPYDGSSGLFAFTWSPFAPAGFVNQGLFTLAADWFDADPFSDGTHLEAADDASASYRLAVVPEPGTGLLLGIGLAAMAVRCRRSAHFDSST